VQLPGQPAWQDQTAFPSAESEGRDCSGQVLHCRHRVKPLENLQQKYTRLNAEYFHNLHDKLSINQACSQISLTIISA
jgi:hypothetical protein